QVRVGLAHWVPYKPVAIYLKNHPLRQSSHSYCIFIWKFMTTEYISIISFQWSERLKARKDAIQSTYRPKREQLKVKPDVKLSDFLAARTSLLQVEKTSSATVRKNTQSDVNKVIIGQVPDRGGRPNEQQPPPPEMPSWQQRGPSSQGGGGGGRGGGGRGRGEEGRGGGRGRDSSRG
ncbi:hypothetical protein O3G_MSEX000176, partial [Manduca sexta]